MTLVRRSNGHLHLGGCVDMRFVSDSLLSFDIDCSSDSVHQSS